MDPDISVAGQDRVFCGRCHVFGHPREKCVYGRDKIPAEGSDPDLVKPPDPDKKFSSNLISQPLSQTSPLPPGNDPVTKTAETRTDSCTDHQTTPDQACKPSVQSLDPPVLTPSKIIEPTTPRREEIPAPRGGSLMTNPGPTDPFRDPGHENPVDAAPLYSDDISIPSDLPPLEPIPEIDTDEETDEGPQLESTPLQDKTRVPTKTFSEKPVTILPTQPDFKCPHTKSENDFPPVFTPAQIEAIVSGNFEGIIETSNIDVEDKMIPITAAEIESQIRKIKDRRKDPAHEDLATVIMKTLKRPLTKDEQIILETPDNLDCPDRWLQWFEQTLNTCEEARRENRNFTNSSHSRPEIVSATRCFNSRQVELTKFPSEGFKSTSSKAKSPDPDFSRHPDRPTTRIDDPDAATDQIDRATKRKPAILSSPSRRTRKQSFVRFRPWADYFYARFGAYAPILLSDLKKTRLPGSLWRVKRWTTPARMKLISDSFSQATLGSANGPYNPHSESPPSENNPATPIATTIENAAHNLFAELPSLLTQPSGRRTSKRYIRDNPSSVKDIFKSCPDQICFPDRFLCAIGSSNPVPTVTVSINGVPVEALIDTGASVSLISEQCWIRAGSPTLWQSNKNMVSVENRPLKTLGLRSFTIRLADQSSQFPFHVMPGTVTDCILGVDYLRRMHAQIDLAQNALLVPSINFPIPLLCDPDQNNPDQDSSAGGSSLPVASIMPPNPDSTRLSVIDTTSILAQSRQMVRCNFSTPVYDGTHVLIETLPSNYPVCVARSLNIVSNGTIWVQVQNPTGEVALLTPQTPIGVVTTLPHSYQEGSPLGFDHENPGVLIRQAYPGVISAVLDKTANKTTKPDSAKQEFPINWEGSSLDPLQRETLRQLLLEFDLFVTTSKAPGRTDRIRCTIDTGDATPIKSAPFRVSQKEGELMEAEIQHPWASPVLMIRKPDGSIRFCIDYRKLNDVTIKDRYPMPRVDDLLDVLGKSKYFSTMDVASGYWNVRMDEKSIEKTAFICKFGLYEWLVMPFGLCNAVPQFERLMEDVLRDQLWKSCLVYLDDVIVFSQDFATHISRLREVLSCLQAAGLKLKMSKCKWGKTSVAFLGHIVTPAGILPNPEKVKSVLKIRPLRNVAEVRAFLGLAGYFRRFIKGFAAISRPLEKLKTAEVFQWTHECDEALNILKRKLVSPPILAYPDFDKPFFILVDACPVAVGAVLMQRQDNRDRVIAYASQALDATQQKWIHKKDGISEIECYGIVWATKKFRPYIDRRPFTIYTDHSAL
ncbi:hypothetical protein AeMF1_020755, partial [Aphanomyces euteiches]